jgi:hypothetical protein
MSSRAEELLDKARRSSSGWRRTELDSLYESFGFSVVARAKHDMAFHPEYPTLKTMLPRHRKVNRFYVEQAVKLIDKLIELQRGKAE